MSYRCQYTPSPSSPVCNDRATRFVGDRGGAWEIPMCGMHAMRFKPPDGYTNRPVDNAGYARNEDE